jgi:hypothetical protein
LYKDCLKLFENTIFEKKWLPTPTIMITQRLMLGILLLKLLGKSQIKVQSRRFGDVQIYYGVLTVYCNMYNNCEQSIHNSIKSPHVTISKFDIMYYKLAQNLVDCKEWCN